MVSHETVKNLLEDLLLLMISHQPLFGKGGKLSVFVSFDLPIIVSFRIKLGRYR